MELGPQYVFHDQGGMESFNFAHQKFSYNIVSGYYRYPLPDSLLAMSMKAHSPLLV